MTALEWDTVGQRFYETGVNKGVLYRTDNAGNYNIGYAWNGLTGVTESPSGAEANPQYADNMKYLNLYSAEDFGATIEAFTYPDAFAECDGSGAPTVGIAVGQQTRKSFGLSYQTRIGNDIAGADLGYKIHLVYGAMAAPSERAYATVNDSPEAMALSWDLTTTPVSVPGMKNSALLTIDSTKVSPQRLADLERILYGSAGEDPRLPLPAEVISIIATASTSVQPLAPTYDAATHQITIPTIAGVQYFIDGVEVSGLVTITEDTLVTARPTEGYVFPEVSDDDWFFDYTA